MDVQQYKVRMAAKKKRRARKKTTGKKSRKKAGGEARSKKPTPAFSFIEEWLRKDKNASYKEIRDAAAKKGLKIAPILYGRVKALMGLVPMRKRGSKKKAARRATGASGRGPGRPRKSSIHDGVVAAITDLQRERDRMRDVLVRIRDMLDQVV